MLTPHFGYCSWFAFLALAVVILKIGDNHEDQPVAANTPRVGVEKPSRVNKFLEDESKRSELRVDAEVLLDQLHRLQSIMVFILVCNVNFLR